MTRVRRKTSQIVLDVKEKGTTLQDRRNFKDQELLKLFDSNTHTLVTIKTNNPVNRPNGKKETFGKGRTPSYILDLLPPNTKSF